VAPSLLQRRRYVHVAQGVVGIDVGRTAATGALDDFQSNISDFNPASDSVMLCPGGCAVEPDIAAEPDRIDIPAGFGRNGAHAFEVYE